MKFYAKYPRGLPYLHSTAHMDNTGQFHVTEDKVTKLSKKQKELRNRIIVFISVYSSAQETLTMLC